MKKNNVVGGRRKGGGVGENGALGGKTRAT